MRNIAEIIQNIPPCRIFISTAAMTFVDKNQIKEIWRKLLEDIYDIEILKGMTNHLDHFETNLDNKIYALSEDYQPPEAIQEQVHKEFKSYEAIVSDLIRQHVASAMKQTASLMKAEETYSSRRSEFVSLTEEQIVRGIFEEIAQTIENVPYPITREHTVGRQLQNGLGILELCLHILRKTDKCQKNHLLRA